MPAAITEASLVTDEDFAGAETVPVSEQTATRDLQALTIAGLLVPHGEKRGRFYTAGVEIVNIRNRVVGKRDPRDDTDPFSISATAEPGQTRLFEVN